MVRNITSRVLAYLLLLIVLVVATCYFCRKMSIFRGLPRQYSPWGVAFVSCGISAP